MSCQDRDSDLLLLSHKELGLFRLIALNVHLLYCVRCNARLGQFNRVSKAFAQAIGPTREQRSTRPTIMRTQPAPPGKFLLAFGATVVLAAALVTLTAHAVVVRLHPAAAAHPTAISCDPGLPSDKCR
jgi:hypothetical protein